MNSYMKNKRFRIIFGMALVILLAIIINVSILIHFNEKNSRRTLEVLSNEVVSVLERNKQTERSLIISMKDEYIMRAELVAYIIDSNPGLEDNILELSNISVLMNIDEIHIFDENGILFGGTIPKYYGLTFDSGEQVAYFKPMLMDKGLAMCQDITPNTAEAKNMMYAITWNSKGDKMIQIGIEPRRLVEELKRNDIPYVVANMPVYNGYKIYVADINSGTVYGSTDKNAEGKTLESLGIVKKNANLLTLTKDNFFLDGYRNLCQYTNTSDYVVAVLCSTKNAISSFLVSLLIELLYLIGAAAVVYSMIYKVVKADKEKKDQLSILSSMSEIYYSMHFIDLLNNSVHEYTASGKVKEIVNHEYGADIMMRQVMTMTTLESYLPAVLEFTNLATLPARMKNKKIITMDFEGNQFGWCSASFITIEKNEEGKPTKVIYVTRDIDKEKRKEEKLILNSNTDELTGLLNRRAYEDYIADCNDQIKEDDLVYVSIDVNGLKVVNDSLGHNAGDELLIGAAQCMKQCFGPYGKVYRVGGDEFVAIINTSELELENIKTNFEDIVTSWSGKAVNTLSVSCGYVAKCEFGLYSIHEISTIADKRMYEAKSEFYRKRGVDRRGQKEAHTALCELYTKILKVNISEDTYQIINMDINEKTTDKGFSPKISSWLENFGKTGQVHPDDLEEYLKKTSLNYINDYFDNNKTSLNIFYRRKFNDEYKQVMMELIPSSDYTSTDKNLFLYVKNIDKY